jgi:hypothetical protein
MFKKTAKIIPIFYFLLFLSIWAMPFAASAADFSLDFLTEETSNPGEFVNNVYKFALGISGAAAFAVIIYGAILYTASAGNSSKQQEAKEWIKGAVFGVILLLAAYLILYTINPNLVNLANPDLEELNITDVSNISGAIDLTDFLSPEEIREKSLKDQENRNMFFLLGISVNNSFPVTDLSGLRQKTIDEIKDIGSKVGYSNITITGGTEAGHADGDSDHAGGYKFDLRTDADLHNYIINNFEYVPDEEKSHGVFQYVAPSGAIYTRELNHWDVLVK